MHCHDAAFWLVVVGLLCLQGLPICGMTETVVLNRRNSRTYIKNAASVIVRSEEYYRERKVRQSVQIMPLDKDSQLIIQFNYLDIEKRHPCRDHLSIYEPAKNIRVTMMMDRFCGKLEDFFGYPIYDHAEYSSYLTTQGEGNGVMIRWVTHRPTGQHRGFQVTISVFKRYIWYGISQDGSMMFKCNDEKYIPMELQCDNVTNCADWSDETNCTLPMLPPFDSGPGLKQKVRCVGLFGGHCSLYKYWLSWTLPLIAILTLALIALKGNRLRQRRRMIRQLRLERLNQLREAADRRMEICHRLARGERLAERPPPIDVGDGVSPVVPILSPPPYSPREQPPPYKEHEEEEEAISLSMSGPRWPSSQHKDDSTQQPTTTSLLAYTTAATLP